MFVSELSFLIFQDPARLTLLLLGIELSPPEVIRLTDSYGGGHVYQRKIE